MNRQQIMTTVIRPWNWSAILAGVFLALALQVLLQLLGAALGLSLGDGVLAGGFAVWSLIVQPVALFLGAVLAGCLCRFERPIDGMMTGVFVWAIAVVMTSGLLSSISGVFGPQTPSAAVWGAFWGALLGLGLSALGGALGVRFYQRVPTAGEKAPIWTPPTTTTTPTA